MPWRPDQREAQRQLESPYEDVPAHLFEPLWDWCVQLLTGPGLIKSVGIALRLELPGAGGGQRWTYDAKRSIRQACYEDPETHLDLVEILLRLNKASGRLDTILTIGNSIYRVRADQAGLEVHTPPEVKNEVQAVVDSAVGSAGAHLANAWNAAYGRTSDPVKAYSEAIKAVEAASAPVLSPKNDKATLGTLYKDIDNKPEKWKFVIDSSAVDPVLHIRDQMRLLWLGQTSRHGGNQPTKPETLDQAKAAVHIATTLVQIFTSNAFEKK